MTYIYTQFPTDIQHPNVVFKKKKNKVVMLSTCKDSMCSSFSPPVWPAHSLSGKPQVVHVFPKSIGPSEGSYRPPSTGCPKPSITP